MEPECEHLCCEDVKETFISNSLAKEKNTEVDLRGEYTIFEVIKKKFFFSHKFVFYTTCWISLESA